MSINDKGAEVIVNEFPKCSFCKREAKYDMKLAQGGYWAYLCEHDKWRGIKLGTGYGQKLIKELFLK